MANYAVPEQKLEPKRVEEFARFFKRYMSISSVVAAALPIPVTSLKLVPTFDVQTASLTTYASMFSFLALAFVFYTRHALARRMFPQYLGERYYAVRENRTFVDRLVASCQRAVRAMGALVVPLLPLILIAGAVSCMLAYHHTLEVAVQKLRSNGVQTLGEALGAPIDMIPYSTSLQAYYLGFFVLAEAAFIVMAIKEYLQDLLGLSDRMLLGVEPLHAGGLSPARVDESSEPPGRPTSE